MAPPAAAIERLVQYMSRCPFSLERFVNISPDGHVFYRTENAECRPFAYEHEEGETPHAVKRNFQHFKPLDFIADLTQHIHWVQTFNIQHRIGRYPNMAQATYDLGERLLNFCVNIIRLTEVLPTTRAGNHVAGQLLRAGTTKPSRRVNCGMR